MNTITKGTMGFSEGMLVGPQIFSEGMLVGPQMPKFKGGMRQVDWDVLKKFIEENKESISKVAAGLAEDWSHTSGEVFEDGEYIEKEDTYVYGSSGWATPSFEVWFKNGSRQMFECWKLGDDAYSYFVFD